MTRLTYLKTAWLVRGAYRMDGFLGMICEGRQRIGKSSLCSRILASAYGKWEIEKGKVVNVEKNWEEPKKWIVFPPEEFLNRVLEVGVGQKQMALLWDDAGFWLFALDWYEPFVKVVSKYIQLAGRQFAGLFLTTPRQTLISSKVLQAMPEVYVCRVIKTGRDSYYKRPRLAKIYQRWDYPDGKRGGVRKRWKEMYNAMLPDPYYEWYKPKSEHYLDEAVSLLKREVELMKQKKQFAKDKILLEKVAKAVGGEDKMDEVSEVITQLTPKA